MARVKRGFKRRRRSNRWLKMAKGYRERRGNTIRKVKEQVRRSLRFAYYHRRQRKRNFRRLWVIRINAACRMNGIKYSQFMSALAKSNAAVDRKILADIAVHDPSGFSRLVRELMPVQPRDRTVEVSND